jgi:hypothetical protein
MLSLSPFATRREDRADNRDIGSMLLIDFILDGVPVEKN